MEERRFFDSNSRKEVHLEDLRTLIYSSVQQADSTLVQRDKRRLFNFCDSQPSLLLSVYAQTVTGATKVIYILENTKLEDTHNWT